MMWQRWGDRGQSQVGLQVLQQVPDWLSLWISPSRGQWNVSGNSVAGSLPISLPACIPCIQAHPRPCPAAQRPDPAMEGTPGSGL